jgi:hypothetical protein
MVTIHQSINTYMKNFTPRCSCIICKEEKSSKGIFTHYLISHTEYGIKHKANLDITTTKAATANSLAGTSKVLVYTLMPNKCACCNTALSYKSRNNTYCSHSCSATIQNKAFANCPKIEPESSKLSRINKVTAYHAASRSKIYRCKICKTNHPTNELKIQCCTKPAKVLYDISGPFSKLHRCTCKHCKYVFLARSSLQYCKDHRDYSTNKRAIFKFRFNVYHYPDLFDLALLSQVGWYSPGGKHSKWDINGLSRDHKVSISDAIANNYDPYIISHPMNCELIPHYVNNKKKSNSSISYNQLCVLVSEFDQKL